MRKLSNYEQRQTEKKVPVKVLPINVLNKNCKLNLGKNCCFIKKVEHNLNLFVTNLYQSRRMIEAGFFKSIKGKVTKTAEVIREEIV